MPGYSVPYYSPTEQSWVSEGALNSFLGLSANLYYGLKDPSKSFYIIAGSTDAAITDA